MKTKRILKKYDPSIEKDIEIGKSLTDYPHYFAPVLASEKIDVVKIDRDNIELAASLPEPNIRSYIMRDIGTTRLFDPSRPTMSESEIKKHHIHLLEALKLLAEKAIVHGNICPDTILYSNGVPLLIRFGDGMTTMPNNFENGHRCIDASHHPSEIIDSYMEKNPLFNSNLNIKPSEKETWRKMILLSENIDDSQSRDNYALAFVFVDYLIKRRPNQTKYIKYLKSILLAAPCDRPSVDQTLEFIRTM